MGDFNMIMAQLGVVILGVLDIVVLVLSARAVVRVVPEEIAGRRLLRTLAWIIYALSTILVPVIGKNDMLTVAMLTLWLIVTARWLYFANKMGIVCLIIYQFVMMGTSYIAITLANILFVEMQLGLYTYSILIILLKDSFLILGTFVLVMVMRKRFVTSEHLKIRGMIIVPIFSCVLMFLFIIGSDVFVARYGFGWVVLFTVMLLVINLYCLYFWYDVAKNQELKHQLQLIRKQNELTLQYYEDLEENYNRSRKIIHDIRNHLQVIEEKNALPGQESGKDTYLEDVHAMLNSLGMKFYSRNKILNIVLNDKLKTFSPEMVDCNLGGVGLEFISDIDITTIFANLLDNMIEAKASVEEKFWVKIRAEEIQDFTVVKLSNPLTGSYKEGKSSKAGHEGLGLKNVRQALAKYNGEMEITTEEQIFSVTLVFGGKERGVL